MAFYEEKERVHKQSYAIIYGPECTTWADDHLLSCQNLLNAPLTSVSDFNVRLEIKHFDYAFKLINVII